MKIHSLSFETWLANHPGDHAARWCRELYPWNVFAKLDYALTSIDVPQHVIVGDEQFLATVTRSFQGKNGRPNFLVHLKSQSDSPSEQWQHRQWNDVFQLVAAPDGHFITLFTQQTDPSKELLRQFMAGGLPRVERVRSLPLSGMLFRSLVAYAATDLFGPLKSTEAVVVKSRIGLLRGAAPPDREITVAPFLSQGSDLWLLHSFTEEKAHRIAITLAGQSRKLISVYCHPTFTRHHRCVDAGASVVSLSEFLGMGSPSIRNRYLPQARFLINHLQCPEEPDSLASEADLRARILSGKEAQLRIHTSNLREAKAGLGRVILTRGDAAYILACANLLNAALNKQLRLYRGAEELEKSVYSFKTHLSTSVEQIIESCPKDTSVYLAPNDLTLITVSEVQFSFHNIPRTSKLRDYAGSQQNAPQEWGGIRLQPIAPLVLAWARKLLAGEGPIRT